MGRGEGLGSPRLGTREGLDRGNPAAGSPVDDAVRTQFVADETGVLRFDVVGNTGYASVKADDAAAIALCEKLGLRGERATLLRMRWADVGALRAELASIAEATVECDDDIERAFALPAGRVAMARRSDRTLVQLRDRDLAVVGFAAFDAKTATPFRVARPALAATLLAALRRHARGDHVQIVVDADDALLQTLRDAGAEIRLQLVHYSGELTTEAIRCA